jgi:hypothetical protein
VAVLPFAAGAAGARVVAAALRVLGGVQLHDLGGGAVLGETHDATATLRRAEANVARKREAREWDDQHGKLIDLSAFQRDILPLIQNVPLSRLQKATGLSLRYVSLIRRGERTPHPRHWEAFLRVGNG